MATLYKDLTGQKFGRLTAVKKDETKKSRKAYWICLCECGNIKSVRSDSLQSGKIRSCGCLKKEQDKTNLQQTEVKKKTRKFGKPYGKLRIHTIWANMKRRCYKKSDKRYQDYGGRGIYVCEEWKNDFFKFYEWSMNNGYTDKLSIDRINNNDGYKPENCRWVTVEEQSNNRRSNINITIGNETKTLKQWCDIFGLPYGRIHRRYKLNPNRSIDDLFRSELRGNRQTTGTVERRE